MQYGNEIVRRGTRFYKFISEDEYEIYVLIETAKNKYTGKFMNEETFELIDITEHELERDYTMLSNDMLFIIVGYYDKETDKELSFVCNEDVNYFLRCQHIYQVPEKIEFKINMSVYRFMTKAVFDKTFNYILSVNNLFKSLSESELKTVWDMYFRYMSNSQFILEVNSKDVDMEDVVNNNGKIPDSIFIEAEEYLNTCILTYEAYHFDDSVNIDNINMKHFFIYDKDNDKYYLVLYVIDTNRVANERINLMNENMDIVSFMLD